MRERYVPKLSDIKYKRENTPRYIEQARTRAASRVCSRVPPARRGVFSEGRMSGRRSCTSKYTIDAAHAERAAHVPRSQGISIRLRRIALTTATVRLVVPSFRMAFLTW